MFCRPITCIVYQISTTEKWVREVVTEADRERKNDRENERRKGDNVFVV